MVEAVSMARTTTVLQTAVRAPAQTVSSVSQEEKAQISPISPAIRFDPKSGLVITEFFDNEGNVQTQIPSAASIAYRKNGVSNEEIPKKSAEKTEQPSETSLAETKAVEA